MDTAYRDNDLVFCTRWGTGLSSGDVLRRFRQLLARAGVKTRYVVHDPRHMVASVLLPRGTPRPAVLQIPGRAEPRVTAAVYAHLVPRGSRVAPKDADAYYREEDRGASRPAETGDGQPPSGTSSSKGTHGAPGARLAPPAAGWGLLAAREGTGDAAGRRGAGQRVR